MDSIDHGPAARKRSEGAAGPKSRARHSLLAALLGALLAAGAAAAMWGSATRFASRTGVRPDRSLDNAQLAAIAQGVARLQDQLQQLRGAAQAIEQGLDDVRDQLDARMMQAELERPIVAEMVVRRASGPEEGAAECRIMDRVSRTVWIYRLPLGDEPRRTVLALAAAARQTDPAARSFEAVQRVLERGGCEAQLPPDVLPACSYVFAEPPEELPRLIEQLFGVEPTIRRYVAAGRTKAISWKQLVRRLREEAAQAQG